MTPSSSNGKARLPLAGVKVLELGTIIAGPFTGSLLADLGATVIKVETPGDGDGLRSMGPRVEGVPLWWGVASRGKECIALDLKNAAGRQALESLVVHADVLVENFRPGVLDRLGFGVPQLHELNPALVVLSISGFGQDGPYAQRAGFGKIAEGMSGIVPLTGEPGHTPLFVGYSLADTTAGLFGALAVNVALYAVADGRGMHIDLALYEPLLRLMDAQFGAPEGRIRQGTNNPFGWGVPADGSCPFVRCRDGSWIQVDLTSAPTRQRLGQFLQDGPDGDVRSGLQAWAKTRSAAEVQDELGELHVAAAPVMDALQIAGDDYFRARGDVLQAEHARLGTFAVPGFFPKAYPAGERAAFRAAAVGEDTRRVLATVAGMSESDITALAERGAFGPPEEGLRRQP